MAMSAFDDAFRAAQPPAVQALMALPTVGERQAQAQVLAGQGYHVNIEIMVWGWDAELVMDYNIEAGNSWLTWLGGPSLSAIGRISPEGPAPAGAFLVTTDPAAYPPFAPPQPPPSPSQPSIATWVGRMLPGFTTPSGGTWWQVAGPGCPLSDGESYVDPSGRGSFTYHASGPFLRYFSQP